MSRVARLGLSLPDLQQRGVVAPTPCPLALPSSLGLRQEGQEAGVDCLGPRLQGRGSYSSGMRKRRLHLLQGHLILTVNDQDSVCRDAGRGVTHLGSSTGVAQEVGAGD